MANKTYRWNGPKNKTDGSERLILEGGSVNPERYVDLKGEIDLSQEEYDQLSKTQRFSDKGVDEGTTENAGDSGDSTTNKPDAPVAGGAGAPGVASGRAQGSK